MYYTLEKTAEILELQPGDVNRLREQGKLRAFRDGANWKFRKEDVEKYLTDLIRERSKSSASNLLNDSDEELPTMLADSASFDSMIDATSDSFITTGASAPADDFALNDDLVLAADDQSVEDDGLSLANASEDDGLSLAKEESDVADSASSLDLSKADDANVLDGASDDNLLHLGSDSGLSLLDDVSGLDGSNVGLGADDGDVVLGGSGSSGSGSSLNLGSDSGLSLLDDAAADFALDSAEPAAEPAAEPEDDGSIFELAEEPKPAAVLELEKDVDQDTATVLNAAGDEGFQLGSNSSESSSGSVSESESEAFSGVSDMFTVDDASGEGKEPDFLNPSDSDDSFGFSGTSGENFADSSAFGASSDSSLGFTAVSDDPLGAGSQEENVAFGAGSTPESGAPSEVSNAIVGRSAPETQFTGKDFFFLVPCLLFLILATIGSYELVRMIWSDESYASPVLDVLAKTLGLIK